MIALLTIGVCVGAGGVYLAYSAWHSTGGSALLRWIGAVSLLVTAWFLSNVTRLRSGPCPSCGTTMLELSEGRSRACEQCTQYLTGNDKELWIAPPDAVSATAVFGARLPERFAWPDGCCICRQPTTRTVPVSLSVSQTGANLAASAVGLVAGRIVVRDGKTIYSVDAPHCAQHNDGATLETQTLGPVRILFRSLAFQREFRERNNASLR